ncbi:hypothetical protein [Oceanicaulis sp.]|uniref:hypothetical protein n=1 Tax=Oceanicaulis sp. TaxID=1924941 RepID=UPI003F70C87B
MSGSETDEQGRKDRDDLIEDTLGFNLRSLKTVYALLATPRSVMQAITEKDRERYTPMLRLFLGLMGIQVALSVIWGGHAGILEQSLSRLSEEQLQDLQTLVGRPLDEFYAHFGNIAGFLQPILVGLFTACSVLILRLMGDKRPFSVNLNLMFAILNAGSIIGLVLMIPQTQLGLPWALGTGLVMLGYFQTVYRGMPESVIGAGAKRWGYSLLMTLVLIILILIAGIVMQSLSLLGAYIWP